MKHIIIMAVDYILLRACHLVVVVPGNPALAIHYFTIEIPVDPIHIADSTVVAAVFIQIIKVALQEEDSMGKNFSDIGLGLVAAGRSSFGPLARERQFPYSIFAS